MRTFSYEGMNIYYEGDRWVAVNDEGVAGTSERPLTRNAQGLNEDDQSWATSVTNQIRAQIEAGAGGDCAPPPQWSNL